MERRATLDRDSNSFTSQTIPNYILFIIIFLILHFTPIIFFQFYRRAADQLSPRIS